MGSPCSGAAMGGVVLKSLAKVVVLVVVLDSNSLSLVVDDVMVLFVDLDDENTRDKPNDANHISHKQTNE